MHVALVGSEDVHCNGAEERVSGFLEHRRLADMAEAEAAIFDADMGCDQTRISGKCNEFATEFLGGPVMRLPGVALQRDDLVANESPGALLQLLQLGGEGKIHQ